VSAGPSTQQPQEFQYPPNSNSSQAGASFDPSATTYSFDEYGASYYYDYAETDTPTAPMSVLGEVPHEDSSVHQCTECGETFSQPGKLRHVVHIYTPMTTDILTTFGNRKHMHKHEKPIKCPVRGCQHADAENRDLNRHCWTYHKEYAKKKDLPKVDALCESCGKHFTRKDNLKRHKDEGRCLGR
jgi:hypothetical protein